jgi:hypothetical protein
MGAPSAARIAEDRARLRPLKQQIPETWARVLHDEDVAHAIIDRVLDRGRPCRSIDRLSAPFTSTLTTR